MYAVGSTTLIVDQPKGWNSAGGTTRKEYYSAPSASLARPWRTVCQQERHGILEIRPMFYKYSLPQVALKIPPDAAHGDQSYHRSPHGIGAGASSNRVELWVAETRASASQCYC